MKAMTYDRYGGPEVLELSELPKPKFAQNSVLVKVKAAGVNPVDCLLQEGAGESLLDAWFPVIPGWDVAGIVEDVGPGVSEFKPGDEVIGYFRDEILRHGTYAELVAGPVEAFAHKPRRLSWAEAGGLPLAGLTAYRAIVRALNVQGNEKVLVHGAGGAVGSLASQIALSREAHVIGSAAETNHAFLESLGVEPVTYGKGLVEQVRELVPDGVDVVLDCGGHGALLTTPEVGNTRTRACSVVEPVSEYPMVFVRREQADLVALGDLADAGKLIVRIGRSFPLEQAADAQRTLREGRANGKVVLEIT